MPADRLAAEGAHDLLLEECFGPVTVVARYEDDAEVAAVLARLPGNLTATVHLGRARPRARAGRAELLAELTPLAGRVLVNGWPTGVAVAPAQHHGGPYPATTSTSTSVGGPPSSAGCGRSPTRTPPPALLPPELRDDNPLGLPGGSTGAGALTRQESVRGVLACAARPLSDRDRPGRRSRTRPSHSPLRARRALVVRGGVLTGWAGARQDRFVPPTGEALDPASDAPRLLGAPEGDFQLIARVTVGFAAAFDAGVLYVHVGERAWAKLCLEYSPDVPTVCTVVTRGHSDDANSFTVDGSSVWLRISRTGRAFAFHASRDGESWTFVRLFTLGDEKETGRGAGRLHDPVADGGGVCGDVRPHRVPAGVAGGPAGRQLMRPSRGVIRGRRARPYHHDQSATPADLDAIATCTQQPGPPTTAVTSRTPAFDCPAEHARTRAGWAAAIERGAVLCASRTGPSPEWRRSARRHGHASYPAPCRPRPWRAGIGAALHSRLRRGLAGRRAWTGPPGGLRAQHTRPVLLRRARAGSPDPDEPRAGEVLRSHCCPRTE